MSARPNDYWAPRVIDLPCDLRRLTKKERLDRHAASMRLRSRWNRIKVREALNQYIASGATRREQ